MAARITIYRFREPVTFTMKRKTRLLAQMSQFVQTAQGMFLLLHYITEIITHAIITAT